MVDASYTYVRMIIIRRDVLVTRKQRNRSKIKKIKKKPLAERLSEIYEIYKPDLREYPTADQIITGTAGLIPERELNFDEQMLIGNQLVDALNEAWIKTHDANISFRARAHRMFVFMMAHIGVELSYLLFHKANITLGMEFTGVIPSFGRFLDWIGPLMEMPKVDD